MAVLIQIYEDGKELISIKFLNKFSIKYSYCWKYNHVGKEVDLGKQTTKMRKLANYNFNIAKVYYDVQIFLSN